jgi:hypothetical protein
MARGLPDYFNPDTIVSQRLLDVGQLFAACFGAAPIDNRGRVVWLDNFREGLAAWTGSVSGTGVLPVISNDYAFIPPGSAKLDPSDGIGAGTSILKRCLHFSYNCKMGVEVSLLKYNSAVIYSLTIASYVGGTLTYGLVKLDDTTGDLMVNNDGAWVTLDNLGIAIGSNNWVTLKVVVDFDAGTYLRLIANTKEYDLSDYVLVSLAGGSNDILLLTLTVSETAPGTGIGYIGHVVLTLDEP